MTKALNIMHKVENVNRNKFSFSYATTLIYPWPYTLIKHFKHIFHKWVYLQCPYNVYFAFFTVQITYKACMNRGSVQEKKRHAHFYLVSMHFSCGWPWRMTALHVEVSAFSLWYLHLWRNSSCLSAFLGIHILSPGNVKKKEGDF